MDRFIQDDLVGKILAQYPDDAILAEENDLRHDIADGNVWVIDPIDGTNNFITQRADFAIMLAYFENGQGKMCIRDRFDSIWPDRNGASSIRPMPTLMSIASFCTASTFQWLSAD